MSLAQVFDMLDVGLVVLDLDFRVRRWNRWMALKSGIEAAEIEGRPVFDFFPNLNTRKFIRNCISVATLGNFSFFSQKLHSYLFPFKPISSFSGAFEYMQQSCTLAPLRDGEDRIRSILISVLDVTEVVSYERRLIEKNMRDALTGAYNRRFLETRIIEEYDRHRRYSRPLSVLMFDIDHFKKINDEHGHQFGDEVLKTIVKVVHGSIRKTDFLVRYGGEEFCCILPETPVELGGLLAERLRQEVEEIEFFSRGSRVPVSVSLGVAALDGETEFAEMLLKKADEAMYGAKGSGRNRVVIAGG